MDGLRTTGRKRDSSIVLNWSIAGSVLMCVYFIFRRDPIGILAYLAKLADLHSQFDANPETQICLHRRRAFAASPRNRLIGIIPRFVSDFEVPISDLRQPVNLLLSNPSPCESVRGRWDDRKR